MYEKEDVQMILLFYVLYKKKNRKTIFLTFLSIAGLAFHFEYLIYISKGYKYKTKIYCHSLFKNGRENWN